MPRSMVGLLAAVGATMFALVSSAHGVLFLLTITGAAAATGLAAYGALCPNSALPPSPPVGASAIKKTVLMSAKVRLCPCEVLIAFAGLGCRS
jgi:hypothetical protein